MSRYFWPLLFVMAAFPQVVLAQGIRIEPAKLTKDGEIDRVQFAVISETSAGSQSEGVEVFLTVMIKYYTKHPGMRDDHSRLSSALV